MEEGKSPTPRLRIWYAAIQAVVLAVFVRLCWVCVEFELIFEQLDMKHLPVPTEAFLALARAVRTPVGTILVAALAVVLAMLGLRGKFDPRLRKLIAGNVIGLAFLIGFGLLSLYLPIIKIQQALERR